MAESEWSERRLTPADLQQPGSEYDRNNIRPYPQGGRSNTSDSLKRHGSQRYAHDFFDQQVAAALHFDL